MPRSINCRRASHINIIVESLAATVAHWEDMFGGKRVLDMPGPDWHACLIELGGFIAELFEPKNWLLNSRTGPHYLGMEYEADLAEARAATADHSIRIVRDIDVAFHTDPADSFGVAYEWFDGSFYDPATPLLKVPLTTPDELAAHPLCYTGLVGYTHAVADLAAASDFVESYLGGEFVYKKQRAGLGAQALGYRIANDFCELVSPAGEGALMQEMLRTGQGIRSMVLGVRDVAAARGYLEGRGLRVIAGTAPGAIAVDPRDNHGILLEFAG